MTVNRRHRGQSPLNEHKMIEIQYEIQKLESDLEFHKQKTRLIKEELDEEKDIWLYKQAISFGACQTVQRYFLETLKTDGSPVLEGDEDTDCIYLFKKSERTLPSN